MGKAGRGSWTPNPFGVGFSPKTVKRRVPQKKKTCRKEKSTAITRTGKRTNVLRVEKKAHAGSESTGVSQKGKVTKMPQTDVFGGEGGDIVHLIHEKKGQETRLEDPFRTRQRLSKSRLVPGWGLGRGTRAIFPGGLGPQDSRGLENDRNSREELAKGRERNVGSLLESVYLSGTRYYYRPEQSNRPNQGVVSED